MHGDDFVFIGQKVHLTKTSEYNATKFNLYAVVITAVWVSPYILPDDCLFDFFLLRLRRRLRFLGAASTGHRRASPSMGWPRRRASTRRRTRRNRWVGGQIWVVEKRTLR